jgi:hypothetical protein
MSNTKGTAWLLITLGFALLLLVAVTAGCASAGLYQMSDEWCAKHIDATPARCKRNPLKEYDVQGHMPPVREGDLCPGRYELGAAGYTITCWGFRS